MENKTGTGIISFALQLILLFLIGFSFLIAFAGARDGYIYALLLYVPLGFIQMLDALVGLCKGVRWRGIYFLSAITYLFLISLLANLPFGNYDYGDTFFLVSIVILPGFMAASYCYLKYQDI